MHIVPAGSPSRGGELVNWCFEPSQPQRMTARLTWWGCYVLCPSHKPTELAQSFFFRSCFCFCLYGPFNCNSFHKFSRQLSAFLLCSSGLILPYWSLFMNVSLGPDIILTLPLLLPHSPLQPQLTLPKPLPYSPFQSQLTLPTPLPYSPFQPQLTLPTPLPYSPFQPQLTLPTPLLYRAVLFSHN